jgi:hypothetical protein
MIIIFGIISFRSKNKTIDNGDNQTIEEENLDQKVKRSDLEVFGKEIN